MPIFVPGGPLTVFIEPISVHAYCERLDVLGVDWRWTSRVVFSGSVWRDVD